MQRLILSGEPAGSIPATKKLIEELWGAKAADTAGMTELGTIMIFECAEQPGGTHIIEDHYIEEVIDPVTRRARRLRRDGRAGRDVVRPRLHPGAAVPDARPGRAGPGSTCPCGRTFDIYDGGIRGRVDDMKLVRGTNVYPRAVEAIVREHAEIDEFQIHLYTAEGIRDEIEVLVEIPGRRTSTPRAARELGRSWPTRTRGFGSACGRRRTARCRGSS